MREGGAWQSRGRAGGSGAAEAAQVGLYSRGGVTGKRCLWCGSAEALRVGAESGGRRGTVRTTRGLGAFGAFR